MRHTYCGTGWDWEQLPSPAGTAANSSQPGNEELLPMGSRDGHNTGKQEAKSMKCPRHLSRCFQVMRAELWPPFWEVRAGAGTKGCPLH